MRNKNKARKFGSIQKKIDTISDYLREHNYSIVEIQAKELISYFDGEAPSGDTITLEQVLQSKWLLVHEVVEICELKKLGYSISFDLLVSKPIEVFQAHLTATKWELQLAKKEGADEWIRKRLNNVRSWLEDPNLLPTFTSKCHELLQKYG
ncbi:MAG: hypothetical protein KGD59_04485 [Candidatus Heimdallarchaeota archaeon]|nr:hypothetical protein [Candidatus Heimdallarchaeota archaeon]MBY8993784.1 hypothetical protein [Candidatus Heimdallarchaeota archaeon]